MFKDWEISVHDRVTLGTWQWCDSLVMDSCHCKDNYLSYYMLNRRKRKFQSITCESLSWKICISGLHPYLNYYIKSNLFAFAKVMIFVVVYTRLWFIFMEISGSLGTRIGISMQKTLTKFHIKGMPCYINMFSKLHHLREKLIDKIQPR